MPSFSLPHMTEESESLFGLAWVNGELVPQVTKPDGSTQHLEPESWYKPDTEPLSEIKRGGLTRKQHVARSLDLEATAMRLDSTSTGMPWSESAAADAFCQLLACLGGNWVDRAAHIRKELNG